MIIIWFTRNVNHRATNFEYVFYYHSFITKFPTGSSVPNKTVCQRLIEMLQCTLGMHLKRVSISWPPTEFELDAYYTTVADVTN